MELLLLARQEGPHCRPSCGSPLSAVPIRAQWSPADFSKPTRRHLACVDIMTGAHHKSLEPNGLAAFDHLRKTPPTRETRKLEACHARNAFCEATHHIHSNSIRRGWYTRLFTIICRAQINVQSISECVSGGRTWLNNFRTTCHKLKRCTVHHQPQPSHRILGNMTARSIDVGGSHLAETDVLT